MEDAKFEVKNFLALGLFYVMERGGLPRIKYIINCNGKIFPLPESFQYFFKVESHVIRNFEEDGRPGSNGKNLSIMYVFHYLIVSNT